ncbi:MAG: metal-dependent transcriptional regulator [Ruminococcaceae bacterium]|nr:metal-dependent transcriptional regulator [Oscillospiraceae bacterium]
MALQESGEMYLESIYVLLQKSNFVRSIDVCEYMGFSKPSVSRAVGLLKEGEYIVVDPDGYITLTDKGVEVATKMYERHTLLTKFLMNLGVSEEVATDDACKIEHHLSDESFEALKKHAEKYIN